MAPRTLLSLPVEVMEVFAEHCSQRDLAKFMLTSKDAFNKGVRTLWRKDARYGNSSALDWAVRLKDEEHELSTRIIEISLYHGGNIDTLYVSGDSVYTALHYAAARGSRTLTAYLLRRGASPFSRALNLHDLFPIASALLRTRRWLNNTTFNVRNIEAATWYPTLIPFIKKDKTIMALFLKAEAHSMLASPLLPLDNFKDENGNVPPAFPITEKRRDANEGVPPLPDNMLTMLHASVIMGDETEIMKQIRRNHGDLEAEMIGTLATALHLAVAMGDEETVMALINAGADVNALDSVGNSPLHLSASSSAREICDFRNSQPKIAAALIQAGANSNMPALGTLKTPMLALASRVKRDWVHAHHYIKKMLDILIDSGADLNMRDARGKSVLFYLARAILKKQDANGNRIGHEALEKLFKNLVERGADIFLPGPGNVSLTVMIITSCSAARFQRWFMTLNPRILPHEATTAYRAWIKSDDKWYSGYDVCQHSGLVDQRTIDRTIGEIWASQHEKFKLIRTHFRITADSSWMIWDGQSVHVPSLGKQHPKPLPIIDFEFNPNYKVNGAGYLHAVARKFAGARGQHYKQNQAIQDAEQFIQAGIQAGARDFYGRTALMVLRDTLPPNANFPYKAFWKYLADAEGGRLTTRVSRFPPIDTYYRGPP